MIYNFVCTILKTKKKDLAKTLDVALGTLYKQNESRNGVPFVNLFILKNLYKDALDLNLFFSNPAYYEHYTTKNIKKK